MGLDATLFTPEVLIEMATAQVADPKRKVRCVDPKEADAGQGRIPTEARWYAVELQCGERLLFFKFAFLKGSRTELRVVSFHEQQRPWKH